MFGFSLIAAGKGQRVKCGGTAVSAKSGKSVESWVSVGGGVYKLLVGLSLLLFESLCLDIQNSKLVDTALWLFSLPKSGPSASHAFAFPFSKTCPRCGMNTGTTTYYYISLGLLFQN